MTRGVVKNERLDPNPLALEALDRHGQYQRASLIASNGMTRGVVKNERLDPISRASAWQLNAGVAAEMRSSLLTGVANG
jgi:hypothetical protein